MEAAGWYQAEGDPPGTVRYWNGEAWVGGPVAQTQAAAPVSNIDDALAGPGIRIGARFFDLTIAGIIFLAATLVLAPDFVQSAGDAFTPGAQPTDIETPVLFTIFSMFFGFVWEVLWLNFAGGTPGKLMFKIRVADGKAPTWQRANLQQIALRSLNKLLSVLGTLVPALALVVQLVVFGIGIASLVMLFSDDLHRTVMDRVGSTVVVKATAIGQPRAGGTIS